MSEIGKEQIEIGESTFSPPKTDDAAVLAAAFGQFVVAQPLKTEYAVLGQFVRSMETGIAAIRTVVVDKTGQVIFAETAGQEAFSNSKIKPKDPMSATMFLVDRLRNVWDLADPQREDAPSGKMAELLRKRSGTPPNDELAAMDERLQVLKAKIATSKVTVYISHLWQAADESSARGLATLLNDQGILQAEPSSASPELKVESDPNEQKVLWDTARAFREFLRTNPPATEYALLLDYGLYTSADGQRSASHVHLILCERTGDWVLVDLQNSHQPDFQSIAPKSGADCSRLAATRLQKRLSQVSVP